MSVDTLRLANFDAASFLRDYWQQKPLLVRGAFPDWHNPIDPDELAGLACEKEVESRLVIGDGKSWKLEHGPLRPARFSKLPESAWTLLVQAVDQHVPDVAALIEPFRFLPDWRIDDVMVSYAADTGGVGPHYDNYDVFLIQGLGRRRWRIGQTCDHNSPLMPHDDLRLLADFSMVEEWVLEPGDMLYLPPRVAHDGVALGGDCMTYSIGFRAPSRRELIAAWCDHVLADLPEDDRYTDPGLPMQANPAEITGAALARLQAMATERLLDADGFARWFGEHTSTPRYPDMDWRPEAPITIPALRAALAEGLTLHRNPASRFAFITREEGAILLFVDGERHECGAETAAFAQALCAEPCLTPDPALAASKPTLELIATLHNGGSISFEGAGFEED